MSRDKRDMKPLLNDRFQENITFFLVLCVEFNNNDDCIFRRIISDYFVLRRTSHALIFCNFVYRGYKGGS